ncbi:hypothetical protein CSB85_5065 [Pseudomonas aeruginosa]|nr:hypothetical protein CSB85_5065 [Pseudomonas aeruginosa]AWE77147.1 hypothetical protein CSC31_5523 [Pseudomonas aeruginosa]AWE99461.1 hypothetical protein CSC26_0511 [Pseudomonas aeruginosa]AXA04875.1 hypothetical protein CSC44_3236 [Pseudomonas aeruginosa]RAL81750.1 hypothetical protein CSC34_3302 [Pseudomonas aeruginosa]
MTQGTFRESARTPGIDGKHRLFCTRSPQHLAVFFLFRPWRAPRLTFMLRQIFHT